MSILLRRGRFIAPTADLSASSWLVAAISQADKSAVGAINRPLQVRHGSIDRCRGAIHCALVEAHYQEQGRNELRPYTGRLNRDKTLWKSSSWLPLLLLALILTSCFGGSAQSQPDPRLKVFHVLSGRIIMQDNQAEVDGTIQNSGHDPFPYDVTISATFYDGSGNVIGQAQGVAEDVFPGTVGAFVLIGQVNSLRYSHMQLTLVSLRERRVEHLTPTPPVSP